MALYIASDEGVSLLKEGRLQLILPDHYKTTQFDVDTAKNLIVYHDFKTAQIKLTNLDTNSTLVLYEDVQTHALVVDPRNSFVYWSDMTDMVGVGNTRRYTSLNQLNSRCVCASTSP